jgi:hypothetical protein
MRCPDLKGAKQKFQPLFDSVLSPITGSINRPCGVRRRHNRQRHNLPRRASLPSRFRRFHRLRRNPKPSRSRRDSGGREAVGPYPWKLLRRLLFNAGAKNLQLFNSWASALTHFLFHPPLYSIEETPLAPLPLSVYSLRGPDS